MNSLYAVCVFGVEFRSFSTAHTSSPMPEMTPNVRYVLIMFDIANETFMVFYYVCSSCRCVAHSLLSPSHHSPNPSPTSLFIPCFNNDISSHTNNNSAYTHEKRTLKHSTDIFLYFLHHSTHISAIIKSTS